MEKIQTESKLKNRYLIFTLGTKLYGTPLLGVREVVAYKDPQPVPNAAAGFEGVINLRGDVIGLIDLRKLLKLEAPQSMSVLIFENEQSILGAAVDGCLAVVDIPEAFVQRSPPATDSAQAGHVLGTGTLPIGMVTLVDLAKIPALLEG